MPNIATPLIVAVFVGGALYLFNLLPIDGTIKRIATVLVLAGAFIWALHWLTKVLP